MLVEEDIVKILSRESYANVIRCESCYLIEFVLSEVLAYADIVLVY